MAINASLFKNEIYMLDADSSSDSRWDALNNDHASFLSRTMGKTLFDDLGIDTSRHQPEKNSEGNLILYGLESKDLNKELEGKKLFGKGSPYMPAPEIKEVPKVDAPVKKAQQAEKTAQKEPVPGGPVA